MNKERLQRMFETFDELTNSFHIIIQIDRSHIQNFEFLNEGRWTQSGIKDYWLRIDKPKFNSEQIHVHIAKEKHINAKDKQVAWNQDTSRHDKKTFNTNFNGLETAKRIAKDALNLSQDAILENINNKEGKMIFESNESLTSSSITYIFRYKSGGKILLKD